MKRETSFAYTEKNTNKQKMNHKNQTSFTSKILVKAGLVRHYLYHNIHNDLYTIIADTSLQNYLRINIKNASCIETLMTACAFVLHKL